MLAATFVAAMVGFVGPAAASLQNPLSVGAQNGALINGTIATASFAVTVNRSGSTPASATVSVTSTLPTDATTSLWTAATGGTQLTNPIALTTSSRTIYLRVTTATTTPAGSSTLTVQASASGSTTRTGSNTLLIRGNQTITFNALANKTFGDSDFNVTATASSGLPVSFTATGNCTVASAAVHLTGAGSCTITATQAGNTVYFAAPSVARTFTIAKANQTITFNALPNRFVGDSNFAVSGSATSGLALNFAAVGSCTVAGSTVSLTTPPTLPGTCTITASQAGNTNYNAAPNVPQTFAINAFTGIELSRSGATTRAVPPQWPSPAARR
jgi:hypothetical protein